MCDLNDVIFTLCVCVSVSFSEYVTLYSKQINNYKLILLACEWLLFFCVVHWHFCFFFFLEAATNPAPTEPVGSKNWFSTSVSV